MVAMLQSHPLISAFFNSWAQGIADVVAGSKTIGEAFKAMAAEMLNALSSIIMAHGWALIGKGFLGSNPADVAMGFLLISMAGVIKGLAQAIGGGGGGASAAGQTAGEAGGRPAPIYIAQSDVAVQQGAILEANTQAINRLNNQLDRLSRESGDVLVERTVRNNPGTVVRPLARNIGRSYNYATQLGSPLLGES
jgi:hypothetical protein